MSKIAEAPDWHPGIKPQKLREFPDWPVEQVIEVAVMLYARERRGNSQPNWNLLTQRACDFLDNLHKAYDEIKERRRKQDAAYRHAEKRSAEADELPDPVPRDKAARYITGQNRTAFALPKLRKLVDSHPHYFGNKPHDVLLAYWQKNGGIPRDVVMESQTLFRKWWPRHIAQENREKAKKRKPR